MTLHVVLSSRTEPPFQIQRLRGQGQVLELDASELAFDSDEIAALLELSLGPEARTLARRLHELTEGWPAAVRLAVHALGQAGAEWRLDALEGLHRPEGPLLDYLAEEVLDREPSAVRRLVGSVAPSSASRRSCAKRSGYDCSHSNYPALYYRDRWVNERLDAVSGCTPVAVTTTQWSLTSGDPNNPFDLGVEYSPPPLDWRFAEFALVKPRVHAVWNGATYNAC